MIEYVGAHAEEATGSQPPVLRLQMMASEEAAARLEIESEEANRYGGVDLSMLRGGLDATLAERLIAFFSGISGGGSLSVAHSDLGSGSDCEHRLFLLTAERKIRESEKTHSEKVKRESSKEKDFAAAAAKRRKGQEGIETATERLMEIDAELADLEKVKEQTSWYLLISQMQANNINAISQLNLSDCGLHATGLGFLTQVLLELEHRAEGRKVSWLTLDGNELQDMSMGVLASYLRLSKEVEVLQLRNVGITENGVCELVAGLVTNRSLRLLDIRDNGLCALDQARVAVSGVQRFNSTVQVLLS